MASLKNCSEIADGLSVPPVVGGFVVEGVGDGESDCAESPLQEKCL